MHRIAIFLASAFLLAGIAAAQESAPREKVRSFTFTQEAPTTVMPPGFNMMFQREKMPDGEISFFSAEMAGPGEVVTAAPYSATAITESTRRETVLNRIGPLQVDSPKLVFINDPTSHTQYILSPGGNATKVVRDEATWSVGPDIINLTSHERGMKEKLIVRAQGTSERRKESNGAEQVKHEDLGTQTIEGVSAEGKRETVTIPAGQIGNDRAIDIVSETWYSPELHTMVLRKHSDPRVGETVFRLTEIKRSEPDASLFQPPAGTKIKAEPLLELHREMAPPKE
jgi:hypothetical protein